MEYNDRAIQPLRRILKQWEIDCTVTRDLEVFRGEMEQAGLYDIGIVESYKPDFIDHENLEQFQDRTCPLLLLGKHAVDQPVKEGDAQPIHSIPIRPFNQRLLRLSLLNLLVPKMLETKSDEHSEDARKALSDIGVLLVEDTLVNQKVGLLLLRKLGIRADLASDGQQAVNKVKQFEYDIVLMDVQMPGMDGLEATEIIRNLPSPFEQPLIYALTAGVTEGEKQRCFDIGMNGFIQKPINIEQLKSVFSSSNND